MLSLTNAINAWINALKGINNRKEILSKDLKEIAEKGIALYTRSEEMQGEHPESAGAIQRMFTQIITLNNNIRSSLHAACLQYAKQKEGDLKMILSLYQEHQEALQSLIEELVIIKNEGFK
ncbi:MAG: hypothetical protein VXZ72_03485 [Chlamydiota bacterium]|nr:hypothetical protein [Chlamydiota bacterium]